MVVRWLEFDLKCFITYQLTGRAEAETAGGRRDAEHVPGDKPQLPDVSV